MHEKLLLITDKMPSEVEINEILKPYCEEIDGEYNENGIWDWYSIGGRYRGQLEAISNKRDVIIGKASWTNLGESFSGVDVDGSYINNIKNKDEALKCYSYMFNGKYNARSIWDGKNWVDNHDFDKELNEIISNDKLFVTVLDIHS